MDWAILGMQVWTVAMATPPELWRSTLIIVVPFFIIKIHSFFFTISFVLFGVYRDGFVDSAATFFFWFFIHLLLASILLDVLFNDVGRGFTLADEELFFVLFSFFIFVFTFSALFCFLFFDFSWLHRLKNHWKNSEKKREHSKVVFDFCCRCCCCRVAKWPRRDAHFVEFLFSLLGFLYLLWVSSLFFTWFYWVIPCFTGFT